MAPSDILSAAQPTGPDAKLLRLCGLYQGHQAGSEQPGSPTTQQDEERVAAWSTADMIEPIVPVTYTGLRAKALAALTALHACRNILGEELDPDVRLAVRALQDVVRGVAA